MKIWIMSDLHNDAQMTAFDLPDAVDADVLVIAGDIEDGFSQGFAWLDIQRDAGIEVPIIWVPGNHDFYRCIDPDAAIDAVARDCAEMGVTMLARGETIEIGGVRFVGATLWTDFAVAGSDPVDIATAMAWAKLSMPDYRSINVDQRRLHPRDTLAWHQQQRAAIERVLSKPFDGPTVVVTHHAPHRLSLHSPAFPNASDASFASDLGDMIERYQPTLWIHGHVHSQWDYAVGDTRVICNPRGYLGERSDFDPELVIEVSRT